MNGTPNAEEPGVEPPWNNGVPWAANIGRKGLKGMCDPNSGLGRRRGFLPLPLLAILTQKVHRSEHQRDQSATLLKPITAPLPDHPDQAWPIKQEGHRTCGKTLTVPPWPPYVHALASFCQPTSLTPHGFHLEAYGDSLQTSGPPSFLRIRAWLIKRGAFSEEVSEETARSVVPKGIIP